MIVLIILKDSRAFLKVSFAFLIDFIAFLKDILKDLEDFKNSMRSILQIEEASRKLVHRLPQEVVCFPGLLGVDGEYDHSCRAEID